MDMEALGLEAKLDDTTFLNDIQGGVNKWIKEIQKATRLIGYDGVATNVPDISC